MTTTTDLPLVTPRQLDILQWIDGFSDTHGYAPTYKQIGHHYGWRSPQAASTTHLQSLRRKGLVEWEKGQARTLRLTPLGKSLSGGAA
jgi:SOS-response transcriptional repressor LexA